jgi:hypothetical protein
MKALLRCGFVLKRQAAGPVPAGLAMNPFARRRVFPREEIAMPNPASHREFAVRARHDVLRHRRRVLERSFEAAAIAYVEDLPHVGADDSRIGVIVLDLESGAERCFHIDLDTGVADACA